MTTRLVRRKLRTLHMVKDTTAKRTITACGAELDLWNEEVTVWSSVMLSPPSGLKACALCVKLPGVVGS